MDALVSFQISKSRWNPSVTLALLLRPRSRISPFEEAGGGGGGGESRGGGGGGGGGDVRTRWGTDVAQWLERRTSIESKDPGLDPIAGQG